MLLMNFHLFEVNILRLKLLISNAKDALHCKEQCKILLIKSIVYQIRPFLRCIPRSYYSQYERWNMRMNKSSRASNLKQQKTHILCCTVLYCRCFPVYIITINVPLILKVGRLFFMRVKHIIGYFDGFFEGPRLFFPPNCPGNLMACI